MERVPQAIHNTLVTDDVNNKLFYYIDPWGETIASISWTRIYYYSYTLQATIGQAVFGRDMISKLE